MSKTIYGMVGHVPAKGKSVNSLARAGLFACAWLAALSAASPGVHARTSIDRAKVSTSGFALPFTNGRVTSRFHQGRWHPAIDLAAPAGTPVAATTSGQKVTFAGRRGGYGNAVITRDAQGKTHLYAHLQKITAKVGQVIGKGQRLGTVGSTGFSTGPHLHYEIRNAAGKHIDPAPLLFPRRLAQSN